MGKHAAAPRDAAAVYRMRGNRSPLLIETKLIVIGIERELNWHRGLRRSVYARARARVRFHKLGAERVAKRTDVRGDPTSANVRRC